MRSREQGDLGEYSAIEWLGMQGWPVALPVGHSPDWDVLAQIDGRLVSVQVAVRLGGPKYAAYEVE
jgi:hypothetical protein